MKVFKRFPIQDFADVPVRDGKEKVRVLFKYPSGRQQDRMFESKESNDKYGKAVCTSCIAKIELEDENGVEIPVNVEQGKDTPENIVDLLINANIHIDIAVFYNEHCAISEEDKKKHTT
jgi:hypothetical protein